MRAEQRASALSEEIEPRGLKLRDQLAAMGRMVLRDRGGGNSKFSKSHKDVLRPALERPQNLDAAAMPCDRPVTSQRSRGTMHDAMRSPAHRCAPEAETHSEPAPPAGTTLRKSATLTRLRNPRVLRKLQKSQTLPSLRLGPAPLGVADFEDVVAGANMPRDLTARQLDTGLVVNTENALARRVPGLRPLPAPVKSISPLATERESPAAHNHGSPHARPRTSMVPHRAHAGNDALAIEQFRGMIQRDEIREPKVEEEEDLAEEAQALSRVEQAIAKSRAKTQLEKDKRDLLSLFDRNRDAGFILDVTGSSPAPLPVRTLKWPPTSTPLRPPLRMASMPLPVASSQYTPTVGHRSFGQFEVGA